MKLDSNTQMLLVLAVLGAAGWYFWKQKNATSGYGAYNPQVAAGVNSASQKQAPAPADLMDWYG